MRYTPHLTPQFTPLRCGGGGLYASFVNTVMAEEDPSHPQWPSNPSNGWISGVDRLTGLPNGRPLVAKTQRAPSRSPTTPLSLVSSTITTAGCSQQVNVDYDIDAPTHTIVSVDSPASCCASCSGAGLAACPFAVFFEGQCFYKLPNATAAPVWREGRVAVWPSGSGPIPPAPAPSNGGNIEEHGSYQHGGGFPAGASRRRLGGTALPFSYASPPSACFLLTTPALSLHGAFHLRACFSSPPLIPHYTRSFPPVNGNPSDGAFALNIPPVLAGPYTCVMPHCLSACCHGMKQVARYTPPPPFSSSAHTVPKPQASSTASLVPVRGHPLSQWPRPSLQRTGLFTAARLPTPRQRARRRSQASAPAQTH